MKKMISILGGILLLASCSSTETRQPSQVTGQVGLSGNSDTDIRYEATCDVFISQDDFLVKNLRRALEARGFILRPLASPEWGMRLEQAQSNELFFTAYGNSTCSDGKCDYRYSGQVIRIYKEANGERKKYQVDGISVWGTAKIKNIEKEILEKVAQGFAERTYVCRPR